MQEFSLGQRAGGKRIIMVPTMGYLHEGHASLLREGRKRCDILVMSLFVNPMQFGPSEDLAKYPRDFEMDKRIAEGAGTDVIFYPDADQMYPSGPGDSFKTAVDVADLSGVLCGKSRPGHFRGVSTVVLKLFNIVLPHAAIFGEKDFQQLTIIKQMVKDLNVPVEIIGMPTVRESDGIAMSSRNAYLSARERDNATAISKGLFKALESFRTGTRESTQLKYIVRNSIQSAGLKEDYIEVVDEESLDPVDVIAGGARIVVAVYAGATRLIDNVSLQKD